MQVGSLLPSKPSDGSHILQCKNQSPYWETYRDVAPSVLVPNDSPPHSLHSSYTHVFLRHTPASGPLHMLFLCLERSSPDVHVTRILLGSLGRYHLPSDAFPGRLI